MSVHLVTGYAGHGHVTSADAGRFNAGICGTGRYVLNTGEKFAYKLEDNNTIKICSGDLVTQGRHISIPENSEVSLTIENGLPGKSRVDAVVMRYIKDIGTGVESASLVLLKGEETDPLAGQPTPQIQEGNIFAGDSVDDTLLYLIKIENLVVTSVYKSFNTIETLEALSNIKPADIGAAASSHKHSAGDITSGILPISCGGTGATTAEDALVNLGINVTAKIINYLSDLTGNVQQQISSKASATHTHTLANLGAAAFSHGHSADDITSGILPVSRGGTGATTATNARTALGIERDTGSVTFDSSKDFGENDTGNGYATIDFPTAYREGTTPTVVATLIRDGNPIRNALTIVSRTNKNFTVKYQHEGSGSITASFQWIAIGTPA